MGLNMRGRKPGQGKFTGGRPEGSPNKKGSMEHEVYFRCGDELFEALSLAAVAACEESVNLPTEAETPSESPEQDEERHELELLIL